jgi:magnesium transporter
VISGLIYGPGRAEGDPYDLAAHGFEPGDDTFLWVDVLDPTSDDLEELQRSLRLHPITLEDAMHGRQRTKIEVFDDYVFLVVRPLTIADATPTTVTAHEVHAIAGSGFLVTIRWSPAYPMKAVQARWVRRDDLRGVGFAVYTLIDDIVDGFLSVIDATEAEADALEEMVFEHDGDGAAELQERLFRLKRNMSEVRRSAMPIRQVPDVLHEEPRFSSPDLAPYYRDVMDHAIRVVELADNVRDLVTSLLEVMVGQASNRLNEAMKRLTAWAGIVLVPTLIAGIYGMNFKGMPELRWQWGYPLSLGLMAASALGLYVAFKRRGWL